MKDILYQIRLELSEKPGQSKPLSYRKLEKILSISENTLQYYGTERRWPCRKNGIKILKLARDLKILRAITRSFPHL
jgi:hypothetical protein